MMLVFICLALAWFFVQHFEKQRQARLEDQHERRMEAYTRLLETLKKKEENKMENEKSKN